MEITDSARRHGISDADMLHAVRYPFRIREQDEQRTLVLGADTTGRLLETIVLSDDDGDRIIHADVCRPKFYDYL